MNRRNLIFVSLLILTVGMATVAQGQASRTWVSGVGDDVNPCSRTAPCKTYAGAISKTAAGGIISTLDPGGFGAVTITKSITIDGSEQIAGVLAASTTGVIINSSTAVVVLRNLEIHGFSTGLDGVRALAASEVYIQNCRIQNFTNDGVKIANTAGNMTVVVSNTDIENNSRGIEVVPSGTGTAKLAVTNSNISGNTNSGVDVAGLSNSASIYGSSLTHNGTGVQVQATSSTAFIEASTLSFNGTGINSGLGGAAPVVRISHSSIVGSTSNGIAGTGTVVGFSNNMIVGNTGSNSVSSSSLQQ
jgi:hypothetical protein